MKYISTLLALVFSLSIYGQQEETIFNNSGIYLSGIWGGSTNGLVSFGDEFSLNNGGFFAFELNDNFLIGWSGYGSGETLLDGRKVDIGGNDLLLGYTFNSYKSVHPVVYIKGGQGSLEVGDEPSENIGVIEPSAGVEVNVFRFMRVGLEGGYRFVTGVNGSSLTGSDLSSPVVGLRLKFGWSWK